MEGECCSGEMQVEERGTMIVDAAWKGGWRILGFVIRLMIGLGDGLYRNYNGLWVLDNGFGLTGQ